MSSQDLEFEIKTFGCKVNSYDAGLLEKKFTASGWKRDASSKPKVFVLNTCAVTAEATKEAVKEVRRIKARSPFSKVVVTGCAAQVDTGAFSELTGVDLVVANSHKSQIQFLIEDLFKGKLEDKVFKSNIFKMEDLGKGGGLESRHTRSFLKIQDGCNSFCTFCIIPFARGKSRSLPVVDLRRKIDEFYAQGVREVVLTGVHVGDYDDQGRKLEDLLGECLKSPMPRLRLTSLEPIELTPRLLELYSDEKMCPHFHISLQSAQTRVLGAMKRQYGSPEVEWALNTIAERFPHAFVGMDIIAGFPGETLEEFSETLQRMRDLPWTRMHVFPYSPRPGVYANRLEGQWPRHEIMRRAKALRELSAERLHAAAQTQIGQTKKVLVLGGGQEGLTRDYWRVDLQALESEIKFQSGQEIEVIIKGFTFENGDANLIGIVKSVHPSQLL